MRGTWSCRELRNGWGCEMETNDEDCGVEAQYATSPKRRAINVDETVINVQLRKWRSAFIVIWSLISAIS